MYCEVKNLSDVLSQNQIDELLKSFSNVSAESIDNTINEKTHEEKIKAYDFKAPKKFTKEQMKVIQNIYESYSRMFSSYLTSITRFFCQVRVLQIEEQRYFEFNNALPDYTMMGNIEMSFDEKYDIMDTPCIIQFSNFVSFSLIDRLLGGYGKNMDISRDFTDIEICLMKSIFEKMCSMLDKIHEQYIEFETRLQSIETNSRINQPIAADEVIVLITLEVEYNDVKNIVTIAIPALTMESIIAKVSDNSMAKNKRFDSQRDIERRSGIIKQISSSDLKIEAILAETKINLDEILSLQPNDIILLNAPITQDISLKINNKKLFDGKLGTLNHKKAVKINNVYNNTTRR